MDRRSFLKLGALLPIAKSVVDKLIADRELALADVMDWHDPVIIGDNVAFERNEIYDEPIFAPDPDRIGEFVEVGRTSPLLACDCYPGLDVQIKTGHCDES